MRKLRAKYVIRNATRAFERVRAAHDSVFMAKMIMQDEEISIRVDKAINELTDLESALSRRAGI